MKFSIIIPTKDSARDLANALNSILVQNFKDYEIIVMDGVSKDGTSKVIKQFAKRFDGRLRWISEPDKGVYDAMNKGIGLAKGEWIYFLGSDDVLYSKYVLERVNGAISKNDLDVIYGNVRWGNTRRLYDGKFTPLKLMNQNICHQAIFYKRDIFKKFGKYNLKYRMWADHALNMQWFNDKDTKKKYIGLTIAKYGIGGFSSVNSQDDEFIKDRDKLIEKYFPKEYSGFNQEIKEKDYIIQQREKELEEIKASVFWKLRSRCYGLRSLFSFKNHS
jgi:glycosyltransferase involved in cell wall biosynthesis